MSIQSIEHWKLTTYRPSAQSTDKFAVETNLPPPKAGQTTLPLDIYEIGVKHPNGKIYGMSFLSFNCLAPGPGNVAFERLVSIIIKKLRDMLSEDYPTVGVSFSEKLKIQQSFQVIRKKTTINLPYIVKRSLFFWFLQYGANLFDYFLDKTEKAIEVTSGFIINKYTICKIMWIFNRPATEVVRQLKWLSKELPKYVLYRQTSTYEDFIQEQIRYRSKYFWMPEHGTIAYGDIQLNKTKVWFIAQYIFMILQMKCEVEKDLFPLLPIEIVEKIVSCLSASEISIMFDSFTCIEINKMTKYLYQNASNFQVLAFKAMVKNPVAFYQANAERQEYFQYINSGSKDTKITNLLMDRFNLQQLILIEKSDYV